MSIHELINIGGNTLREKLHEPCACGIQIGALRSVNRDLVWGFIGVMVTQDVLILLIKDVDLAFWGVTV